MNTDRPLTELERARAKAIAAFLGEPVADIEARVMELAANGRHPQAALDTVVLEAVS